MRKHWKAETAVGLACVWASGYVLGRVKRTRGQYWRGADRPMPGYRVGR